MKVAACPAWSVRDVVAQLTGLCVDWVGQRLDRYATADWTAAQVARSDGWPINRMLDRWRDVVVSFAALVDDPVMGPPGRWTIR